MKRFLIPTLTASDLLFISKYACLGAVLAGLYGIVHDQLTFTISSEYFTAIKFKQFHYADVGLGDRIFVATIGFLAAWWVGFFVGWFLSRVRINQTRAIAEKNLLKCFGIVFITALLFSGAVGLYTYLVTDFYNAPAWRYTLTHYTIQDAHAFMRVVYIHYASYLGGLIGFIVALLYLKFKNKKLLSQ